MHSLFGSWSTYTEKSVKEYLAGLVQRREYSTFSDIWARRISKACTSKEKVIKGRKTESCACIFIDLSVCAANKMKPSTFL